MTHSIGIPTIGIATVLCCLSVMSLAVPAAVASPNPAAPDAKHYVCPPCGNPCDSTVYDKPGVCPTCGMTLVDQASVAAAGATAPPARKVGILVFNGVEILDYTGPYEMFGAAGFDVYTVAETKDPITTAMGMKVIPHHTFADVPQPDVLVVPGGAIHGALQSVATIQWVKTTSARTEHTLSVCNGAFILSKAGLLDGLSATTTAGNIERLRAENPKIKVVDDERVVDNGRIATAGGLSAGIDGALHILSKMIGKGEAQKVALGEEYDWRPGERFARAALADRLIPNVDLDGLGSWSFESTQGNAERWEMILKGTSSLTADELMDRIGGVFETRGKWSKVASSADASAHAAGPSGQAASGSKAPATSRWKFSGRKGEPWNGTLTIRPPAGGDRGYTATLLIERAS